MASAQVFLHVGLRRTIAPCLACCLSLLFIVVSGQEAGCTWNIPLSRMLQLSVSWAVDNFELTALRQMQRNRQSSVAFPMGSTIAVNDFLIVIYDLLVGSCYRGWY